MKVKVEEVLNKGFKPEQWILHLAFYIWHWFAIWHWSFIGNENPEMQNDKCKINVKW
jgi:hypothetical protein